MEFTEGLRKVFLAGVGAVASTAENAKELIDDLVEKGELTVAQGRMLNEELKHTAKEKVKEHISVTVTRNYTDAMNSVDQMAGTRFVPAMAHGERDSPQHGGRNCTKLFGLKKQ